MLDAPALYEYSGNFFWREARADELNRLPHHFSVASQSTFMVGELASCRSFLEPME
jgi:hypothetical protein